MKRLLLLLPLLLLTACTPVHVPPADYDETEPSETEAVTETESTAPETTQPTTHHTERPTTPSELTEEAEETETTTEPLVIPNWAEDYATLLRRKNADSEHQDAYYALIRLDVDRVPELVILDDVTMELYYYAEDAPALLLEDGYKSTAASGQNLCYQPATGKLASAFTTMGGGSGFHFFFYEKADPMHVTRYYFNNNEAEGGEMPYNPLWDRAEEFDIHNNGWTDVTLGESWTHIGTDFADIHKLVAVTGNKLTLEWNNILDDVHETEEIETESEEE